MNRLFIKNYIGYRSDEVYGEGFRDIILVLNHELNELQNNDIIDYFLKNKLIVEDTRKVMIKQIFESIKIIINRGFNRVILLCDKKKYVKEYYNVSKESIYQVKISEGFILSDLGEEGKLIAYKED